VLRYQIVRPEAANSEDFPVFANEQAGPPERRSDYELHLPYTIALRLGWGGGRGMVYFFTSQPESADRCAGYVVIGRNYNVDQSDQVLQEFENTIFGQDQRVVESQGNADARASLQRRRRNRWINPTPSDTVE
jgi:phenylpropionate dioxygenase-like ring-hydroxylating dioxygenase large terminal subunit